MARNRKYGNDTLDILNKGCLDLYEGVACSRISILVLLCAATFFLIVLKLIKYHVYKHSQVHHYAIFYTSAIQCIVCATSFIFGIRYPQLDFTPNFFKLLQFILICHLHWSVAARSRHRDDIVQHVVNPVLCLYTLYCTTVVLMGMVDISGTWTECLRPYWLMLSSADFISVQLFAVVALYLTHSSNRSAISALMLPIVSSQTRDLWLVTAVYEVSAVVSVVFDAVMSLTGREETGCSGIYNHMQLYYSSLMVVVTVLKYFLPTWTLLCVFQPNQVKSRPSEVALTSHYNTDGTCYNQYRRMFFPQNGLSVTMPYPSIPYPIDSPIYGGYGDYSYPDSSPDTSPTIAQRKSGMDDDFLGVAASESALLYVILCPVGSYFKVVPNQAGLSLLADPRYTRAWPGGCGHHKMGSNYAPTIQVQREATEKGLQQVLWLYGDDNEITEVSSMNIFMFYINENGEKELTTPPLNGLILPGITRHSILSLCKEWNQFKVSERKITMREVQLLLSENRLLEMFGAGTACILTPISQILFVDETLHIPTMRQPDPVYKLILKHLMNIQYGHIPNHPWALKID